ncbi:MAG: hypothetical protein ACXACY_06390 [Candidatus Hodarchaeales archaeon]|jgi:hypothetical protein
MASKQTIDKLFNIILKRSADPTEVKRYLDKTDEYIISDLGNCREKFKNLQKVSGDHLKMRTRHTPEDIVDFFSSRKYKVAICLSGHVRNYTKNLPSINEFLVKPLGADVFIHTWDSIGSQILITRNIVGPTPDESNKNLPDFNQYLDNIKGIRVENNQDFIDNFTTDKKYTIYGMSLGSNRFGGQAEPKYIYSQLYSIQQSFKALEEYCADSNTEYDIIIKCRIDYCLYSGIQEVELDDIISNECYYVPNIPYSNHGHPICCLCENGIEHDEHIEDICDVFAYSTYSNMKKYMNVYDNLGEIADAFEKDNLRQMENHNFKTEAHNGHRLVDIWKDINYRLNCFYPERIFRHLLKGEDLKSSKLSGEVLRR